MMKFLLILSLFFNSSTSEFTSITRMQPTVSCENPNKNVLIEHFFNTVFTEFYSSPPACVCIQMCVGQFTYCYPTGCLKSSSYEETEVNTETTQPPIVQKNKNHFMLLKGERDFMTDFLEQNYVDDSKEPPQPHNPVADLRPDVFKKKYNIVGKYKSNVNRRHNIQDKVKKDAIKTEGDWTKTRWPLSSQNWRSGRRSISSIEKPLRAQGTYFAAMLHDNEVAEYPPKYFKRELTKTVDDDEGNLKAIYHFENSLNFTDAKSFSLETLIDNLIKSSFVTNIETTTNIGKRDDPELETKVPIENILKNRSENSTSLANETTNVISMNLTNENVERNKYLDYSQSKQTANLNEMIMILANRIEIENNTSKEIAKKTIKDFDEETLTVINNETTVQISTDETTLLNLTTELPKINSTSNATMLDQISITTASSTTLELDPETTTLHEAKVTKKNRQKMVKKATSKMNNPDINLKL